MINMAHEPQDPAQKKNSVGGISIFIIHMAAVNVAIKYGA
jgi:hypothetical protein